MKSTLELPVEQLPFLKNREEGREASLYKERFTYSDDGGKAQFTAIDIRKGIGLVVEEFDASHVLASPTNAPGLLFITFCQEGRCELEFEHGRTDILDEGILAIYCKRSGKFSMPTEHYKGTTLTFDLDAIDAKDIEFMHILGIDLSELLNMYCPNDSAAFINSKDGLRSIIDDLNSLLDDEDSQIEDVRLLTLSLLRKLQTSNMKTMPKSTSYLTKGQRDIAHEVHDLIVQDPSTHYSSDYLALRFCVSPTSLKTYFRRVYGNTPANFARNFRMRKAAEMLETTTMAVGEIALSLGYNNPSKFAAMFRQAMGTNPLEYRRRSQTRN